MVNANILSLSADTFLSEIAANPSPDHAEFVMRTISATLTKRFGADAAGILMQGVAVAIELRLVAAGMTPDTGKVGALAAAVRAVSV